MSVKLLIIVVNNILLAFKYLEYQVSLQNISFAIYFMFLLHCVEIHIKLNKTK